MTDTEYYRVLQNITEYCRVLLQSITECYRALKSITEYTTQCTTLHTNSSNMDLSKLLRGFEQDLLYQSGKISKSAIWQFWQSQLLRPSSFFADSLHVQ